MDSKTLQKEGKSRYGIFIFYLKSLAAHNFGSHALFYNNPDFQPYRRAPLTDGQVRL